ncbi:hypothetical protein EON62_00860 [archaeon]|nr:MAG: hypothetical protein EON62_00860 [archaeon]
MVCVHGRRRARASSLGHSRERMHAHAHAHTYAHVCADGRALLMRKVTQRMLNGDKYTGEVVEGKRWGSGHLIFRNLNSYMGEFVAGKYHGFGSMTILKVNIKGLPKADLIYQVCLSLLPHFCCVHVRAGALVWVVSACMSRACAPGTPTAGQLDERLVSWARCTALV